MPKISVNENVNSTELNPKKNPDNKVIAINVAIVYVVVDIIRLFARFNNSDFGAYDGTLDVLASSI